MKRFKRLESISFGPTIPKSSGREESDSSPEINQLFDDAEESASVKTNASSFIRSLREDAGDYLSLYSESKRKLGEKAGSLWKEFTEGYTVRFGNKDNKNNKK